MTIPELIAVITGIASVWFARKESILVYPVGLISVILYVYICFSVQLYADAAINFYYTIVSVYGWYFWLKGGKNKHADKEDTTALINTLTTAEHIRYLLGTAALGTALSLLLDHFTDSNVPYWDGYTNAVFCAAMLLMARKKLENWIYWIIGDLVCIPLFFSKGLCLSSIQYIIFTVIAVAGYLSWRKKLQKQYA